MKLDGYKGHAVVAAQVGAGFGLVKAGLDIATGNTNSVVGKLVLPNGTKQEVSWKRGLVGGALAVTGVFVVIGGKIPFPSKK